MKNHTKWLKNYPSNLGTLNCINIVRAAASQCRTLTQSLSISYLYIEWTFRRRNIFLWTPCDAISYTSLYFFSTSEIVMPFHTYWCFGSLDANLRLEILHFQTLDLVTPNFENFQSLFFFTTIYFSQA